MKKTVQLIAICLLLVFSVSCKRDGAGGDAEISVHVKHHDNLIPGAKVYIKYGAKDFPGSDVSQYNDSKEAGTVGHSKGHTHFPNLLKGDYYLYSVAYDSSISMQVSGGIYVKIKKKGEEIETDVPVTE